MFWQTTCTILHVTAKRILKKLSVILKNSKNFKR